MDLYLLRSELRRDEGVRYSIYTDTVGIPTCGVGHNCRESPLPPGWVCPLTDSQVDQLLLADISSTMLNLDDCLPWWRTLSEVRQRVVVNMAFNIGVNGLLMFKNMLDSAKRGDYATAAREMLNSKWAKQVSARAHRLAAQMESGKDQI